MKPKLTYFIEQQRRVYGMWWWKVYDYPFCIVQVETYVHCDKEGSKILQKLKVVQECKTIGEAQSEIKFWESVSNQ